jgi:hypothetical protein
MAKTARTSSWRGWLPDISAAVERFPLGVGFAVLFTFYKLYHGSNMSEVTLRTLGALAACFLWVVAVDLFVESTRRTQAARLVLSAAGILVIALLFWLAWCIWLDPKLFIGALVLLVGLARFLGRDESNSSFWMFNQRLVLGAGVALVGACLFGVGLSIIVKTLNTLFSLELPARWHEHIWTVSLGLIAPVSALAFAPRGFSDTITERDRSEFIMRAAAALVKFVLVPLLLVYTAILYAYAVKIALEWTLPKGTLGSMVVGYLMVGAATLLVGYPIRETGGTLVRLFWRYWVWLTALPVMLLFLAVYRRIADYGVTEERYLMVLIGVWALALAIIRVTRGENFDLRLVPGMLALLLLAASFGPGGAIGFSVMSQRAELEKLLVKRGVLVDGKLVARTDSNPDSSRLGTDASRVRGIEWYLNTHHALRTLEPWFEGTGSNPFAPEKTPEVQTREVLEALGLRPDILSSQEVSYFSHYSNQPAIVAFSGPGTVLGPIVFSGNTAEPTPIPPQTVTVEGLGPVRLQLADNVLYVQTEQGAELRFNIFDATHELTNLMSNEHRPVQLHASSGRLSGTVLIDNLNGMFQEPNLRISLLRFWLVLAKTP